MAGGRIPQNVVQLRARGNPGKRAPVRRAREQTQPSRPNPPTWLSREAAAEWRRVVPELDRAGLISRVDRAVIASFCDTWAKLTRVSRQLDDDSPTVAPRNRGAGRVKHPLWPTYGALTAQLLSLAREIGAGPATRARMPVSESDDDDAEGILD